MSEVQIREFSLPTGNLPGPVSLTLADAADLEKAGTLLHIQIPIEEPGSRGLLLIQIAALRLASMTIDAERRRLEGLHETTEREWHYRG
jgi:hypothetical protein